jgi:hypothetical protein
MSAAIRMKPVFTLTTYQTMFEDFTAQTEIFVMEMPAD